ncbi:MAG: hypothetical protein RLZ55_271, partial [Actinomycetota bacterium]
TVLDVHHIDRGYANFTDLLTALGGKIERVDQASIVDSGVMSGA